jgi:hypothetical protein
MGVNGPGRTRHIPVAQTFRPEVCSGRDIIAVGAKNLTPQAGCYWGKGRTPGRGELQNPSGGMSDLTSNESALTATGAAATPIPHMPLPLRKANETCKFPGGISIRPDPQQHRDHHHRHILVLANSGRRFHGRKPHQRDGTKSLNRLGWYAWKNRSVNSVE